MPDRPHASSSSLYTQTSALSYGMFDFLQQSPAQPHDARTGVEERAVHLSQSKAATFTNKAPSAINVAPVPTCRATDSRNLTAAGAAAVSRQPASRTAVLPGEAGGQRSAATPRLASNVSRMAAASSLSRRREALNSKEANNVRGNKTAARAKGVSLLKKVEISGEHGPLGIHVVPYCSSLSGRAHMFPLVMPAALSPRVRGQGAVSNIPKY
ncbi:hypothetical protein P4O66_002450 [Electrophorus voltai]|uniref:Uncharacterized protein n=1 Tax=Electrophorus voltai TaxID=2609070 RepID=A0AAD9DQZ2_9TELE|nr:hypothetical protein P4O66_002450 [Electrophorus voltai]